jgi:hypothetical protein
MDYRESVNSAKEERYSNFWRRSWTKDDNCVFCYLKTEDVALRAIDKIRFDEKGYCNNQDLLLFFIAKKWTRCLEAYLHKYDTRDRKPTSTEITFPFDGDLYNCNTIVTDSTARPKKLNTVNPYTHTTDGAVIEVLKKHKFVQ